MASDTWSLSGSELAPSFYMQTATWHIALTHAILSGWPSPTDSEVKRKVGFLTPFVPLVSGVEWFMSPISMMMNDQIRK